MTSKKYDVVAMGELLIDFTHNGYSEQGNMMFEANPGGAPCNVLSMLRNFNKKTAFMGKIGSDFLGLHLKNVLCEIGIDTCNLKTDQKIPTTLAFIHKKADGDRDFSFYRNPGADMMYTKEDIDIEMLKNTRIFHFGSLSMTHEKVREATLYALNIAKQQNIIISFDPNLREPLWESLDMAKEQILYGLAFCDILKISEEELEFITGKNVISEGVCALKQKFSIRLLCVTRGKKGSIIFYKNQMIENKGYEISPVIDTTGAGDTFCACILNYILDHDLDNLTKEDLINMGIMANSAAALIVTKKGALKVMPRYEDVLHFMKDRTILYRKT